MTRYIILGQARSGTTVVHFTLRNHPQVSALYDEVNYSPFYDKGLSVFTHGLDKPEEKSKGFLALFDALTQLNKTDQSTAFGLKTAVNTIYSARTVVEAIQKYLPQVKIIYIYRSRLTDQYASLVRAQKTGSWHSWQKDIEHKSPLIRFKKKEFVNYLKQSLEINRLLSTLRQTNDFFEFNYETDILPNKIENYYKLFDFLGIERINLDIALKKVAKPTSEYVKKYDFWLNLESKLKKEYGKNFNNLNHI